MSREMSDMSVRGEKWGYIVEYASIYLIGDIGDIASLPYLY